MLDILRKLLWILRKQTFSMSGGMKYNLVTFLDCCSVRKKFVRNKGKIQTWKKFVSFRDPSLEFIIISAKYPTKNQQFRHFTQIDDWFLLQNCQNTLYFIILSTKEVLFLLKTSILLQLWKKFPQLYRNFRDPGSRGSRVFPCLVALGFDNNLNNMKLLSNFEISEESKPDVD